MSLPDMFDPDADLDAGMWLKAAQAAVRAYCGWHVCPSLTRTVTIDSHGGQTLLLPSKHVTALTSVQFDGMDHTADCTWSEAGILKLHNGFEFPDDLRAVTVSMTDGFDPDEVPELEALLLTIARRAQIQPGITSQSVNGSSVSYSTANQPGVSLFDSEKLLLAPYRIGDRP